MKTLTYSFLILFSVLTFAQKNPIYTTNDGAIKGYDPVAYFVKAEAVKGKEEFTLKWKEADWYFSSQANLEAFKADPEKYAPQFGGYCAYAVGNGYTYRSDPNAWKIVDNKLYLNYSKGIQKKWEANQVGFIKQGEANWPAVIKQ